MRVGILKFAILSLFVASCSDSPDSNTGEDIGRYAQEEEIVGFWELVPLPANVSDLLNKTNPWPLPYQWFAIYEDGRMYTVMTTEDENYSSDALHRAFQSLPFPLQYEFNGGILRVTNPQLRDYVEIWGVNVFVKDGSLASVLPVNEGDLLMSLQSSVSNEIVYYRHLRRLE